ncbi:MAG TPA: pseudouridine synthase [Phycisphaerae bacterium]|nr:pseudouridine synthase [Phycisphaerae bacterium]
MPAERLQKILARAGVASRRACEELLTEGRVTVDGRVVSELGAKADPRTQDIRLDGQRLRPEPLQYWILNKPKGVVCTNDDPAGRKRVLDLMGHVRARVFPVGRLDADSKGLLLVTNDGDLANRLAHPRYEVPKTYLATVSGRVTAEDVRRLMHGVYLAEGRARAARVRVVKRGTARSLLEITLREGRNRQIRRVLASLYHPVRELVRTRIGRIGLRGLGVGRSRPLEPEEIEYLKSLAREPVPPPKAGPGARPSRKRLPADLHATPKPPAKARARGATADARPPRRVKAEDRPRRAKVGRRATKGRKRP